MDLNQFISQNGEIVAKFKVDVIAHFEILQEMLREKGIMPFSDYEKFLPKIINDDRFKGIVITNLKFQKESCSHKIKERVI